MSDNSRICYFYVMDVSLFDHGETFKRYYNMVPSYRREKIDALIPQAAKNLSLGVGVLFETVKNRLGLRESEISSVEDTESVTPMYYNLSHSGTRAVCALANVRIGCDVEKIQTEKDRADNLIRLSERFFTETEALWIRKGFEISEDLPELERAARYEMASETFYKIWTLKESVIKMTGQGLAMPLDSFDIDLSSGEPRLGTRGDWTKLHGIELEDCRIYVPDIDLGYAYGLCIASPEEYEIEMEMISQ